MNGRDILCALGVLSLVPVRPGSGWRPSVRPPQHLPAMNRYLPQWPACVSSIRRSQGWQLNSAVAYILLISSTAVRTFLFGSLVGRALGQKFDEEILYLACILHDLGLTKKFQGESPFEIQGAETARRFLEEQKYGKEKLGIVWDGIAMHASPIGQFKQPEIALVGEGAGADVIAPDFSQIKKSDVEEIVKAFPRLKFKAAFVETCADVIRKHPRAASSSFMRDIRERYVPEFHPRNFCDRVAEAPFTE